MAWVYLILAGCGEIVGIIFMKKFTDTKRKKLIVLIVVNFGISLILLSTAMKTIPMATSYAIWTGIGTTGSALVGFIYFKEKAKVINVIFIALIACGAVGLKVIS